MVSPPPSSSSSSPNTTREYFQTRWSMILVSCICFSSLISCIFVFRVCNVYGVSAGRGETMAVMAHDLVIAALVPLLVFTDQYVFDVHCILTWKCIFMLAWGCVFLIYGFHLAWVICFFVFRVIFDSMGLVCFFLGDINKYFGNPRRSKVVPKENTQLEMIA